MSREKETTSPLVITARDVFNFDPKKALLPTRDRNFSADFLNDNHVLMEANETLKNYSYDVPTLNAFIENIVTYPQIQIPTVNKNDGNKSRYTLDEMMSLHTDSISQTLDEQAELAVFCGDDSRIRSLQILQRSIGLIGIQRASSASITLEADKFKPEILIPLFNITTATKLANIAQLELPPSLILEPPSTYPVVPDERYF